MRRSTVQLRALAAHLLLLTLNGFALATTTKTTTTTLVSTLIISTTTITLTPGASSGETELDTALVRDGVTSIVTAAPAATSTASMAYSGQDFQSAVLNSTNHYRAQQLASPVVWNSTLADFAQNYANACLWQHSGGPYGENLAENFQTPALAIDEWAKEEGKYNYATAKFSEDTGHFTQLVWKNTTSVGCGAVMCDNDAGNGAHGWLLVCEYSPRGNIVGSFRTMVGKPGQGKDGKLGFGGAEGRFAGLKRSVVALVVAYGLLVVVR